MPKLTRSQIAQKATKGLAVGFVRVLENFIYLAFAWILVYLLMTMIWPSSSLLSAFLGVGIFFVYFPLVQIAVWLGKTGIGGFLSFGLIGIVLASVVNLFIAFLFSSGGVVASGPSGMWFVTLPCLAIGLLHFFLFNARHKLDGISVKVKKKIMELITHA